jgi:hypothetical protein
MTRLVFYGFGAYVTHTTGPTTCSWFPDDPNKLNWDPHQLITVDLAKCPSRAKAAGLAATTIEVDDSPQNGGLTKLGPVFPGGVMIGACWLERHFWAGLAARGVAQPQRLTPADQCHDYELTALYDWDTTGKRYGGFHAEIVSTAGTLALCTIWHPGTARVANQPPAGTWWLDLAAVADPVSNGFTAVSKKGDVGALFLEVAAVKQVALFDTKKPPVAGRGNYGSSPDEV